TRALAYELGPRGIRANVVAPGPTETRMLSTEVPASFVESVPLRRLGLPDDVAGAVAFLASDDAAWVTGQVIGVNGGLAMAGGSGVRSFSSSATPRPPTSARGSCAGSHSSVSSVRPWRRATTATTSLAARPA